MRVARKIELTEQERRALDKLARGRRVEARLQQRARAILLAAAGLMNIEIAIEVDMDRRQVAVWRARYQASGIDALRMDAPRSGRPPTVTGQMEERMLETTLLERPVGAPRWSTRMMAERFGVSASTVRRIWRAHGVDPQQIAADRAAKESRKA